VFKQKIVVAFEGDDESMGAGRSLGLLAGVLGVSDLIPKSVSFASFLLELLCGTAWFSCIESMEIIYRYE
tara:strand:- start:48 stop:257 length:210 start_codon:yes stop_codon:yes gene_type:complete